MTILTRNKTQKNRYVTISKFEIDRCYRLARIQLSKELSSNITESYARTLYSPSLEDIEYINNSQAETTSSGYDTSTSTSTFSNDDDDYSTIETFADHDIDWIRSTLDEYEEHGEIWDHHRGLLFFNIVAPFIFIIFMILLKKFFDFND
ncbi:16708_t:CDS:2 [Rhizophagus irregularis]|nr:16708_t:CDS:2 [Rhizophagus irregularis]